MKVIKNFFPVVCCLSLFSCAQAPESSNLSADTALAQTNQTNASHSPASAVQTSAAAIAPPVTAAPMITATDFSTCLISFRQKAQQAGISNKTITDSLTKAKLNTRVLELDRQQPEFTNTFADYFNRRVTDKRIEQGQALLVKHQALLDRVAQQYGVPAPYLLAFWGLETNYGSYFGNIPVVDSLATLGCDPRRSTYFTGELISALRILDEGAIQPDKMIGSWAGAMGHVQFMPTAFLKNAVDYDGDNKRDLWTSTADAMASAANFLQSLGWNASERWGREVRLPDNFPFLEAGLKNSKTIAEWSRLGVTQADKTPLPGGELKASLLVPSGYQGPAFLVHDNFNVIMRWNRSEFYALAVGHLADRIAGGAKLLQPPPEDAPRLHRNQVVVLQEQLHKRGFDVGSPDGILGPGTRRAISEFQHQQGMIADGFPSKKVIGLLGVDTAAVKH